MKKVIVLSHVFQQIPATKVKKIIVSNRHFERKGKRESPKLKH